MDSTTDISPAATTPVAATTISPATVTGDARREAGHPLIWAALLVWLSVEAIGDGVLALRSVLASATASRSQTPTVTPS